MLLFIANNRILFFLHQHPNYEKEWAYLFDKDMQKSGVDHVISDMCMSCTVRYSMQKEDSSIRMAH
jgi:hypothetical protein